MLMCSSLETFEYNIEQCNLICNTIHAIVKAWICLTFFRSEETLFFFVFLQGRNKTRVVTYRCPGNTAVQVYNYLEKTARVVFGPDLVILGPHENFNVLSLSGRDRKCFSTFDDSWDIIKYYYCFLIKKLVCFFLIVICFLVIKRKKENHYNSLHSLKLDWDYFLL